MKFLRTCSGGVPVCFATACTRSSKEGDTIVPGQMALQRIPLVMKSAATALGRPLMEDTPDDILMIEPPPFFSIAGKNALMVRCMDLTLRSKEKSQSFSEHSSTVPWCT